MFLKTLQIKGFKSFADVATLQLEPGVTVVVGPNGSGKSNVVDAIGWVLGAQAPSAVRSQKMDDVIFAGSAKRPALGRAEVGLTIDNSSGILPIEFNEVTITRTLFRSGDSEYAINGVPCRLLDIQELLSDSGVGRQQHVIISQGQIDAVLNAKPEDRRLIIEEAAGVLKYRRRKEKSERRLAATEANLLRIQDLLREVRRQLRPLERQADAARRHDAVITELSALRLHLVGRELARLRTQLAESTTRQNELRNTDREIRRILAGLDAEVLATEAQLSAMGGDDFGDALVRYESLRERARGLQSLLTERRRGIDRDRNAFVDQAVIASLEAEHAQLSAELVEVENEGRGAEVDNASLETATAELAEARAKFEADWGDGVGAATTEAAEIRGELAALRATMERTESDSRRLGVQQESLRSKVSRLDEESVRLTGERTQAAAAVESLGAAASAADAARSAAESSVLQLEEQSAAAAAEHHSWAARAEALGLALDDARQRAGAEHLAELDGVVGTLLDVVEVEAGWEAAFEAAAGEALAAIVVSDAAVARRALDALSGGQMAGAVLAVSQAVSAARVAVPAGVGEPVRSHVKATRPDVEPLLDALLSGAVAVEGDWSGAVDAAIANPAATIVTRQGDRFGVTGWRIGQSSAGATGAALAEAEARLGTARTEAEAAAQLLAAAKETLAAARRDAADAEKASEQNAARLRTLEDALRRVDRDRAEAGAELATVEQHLGELAQRVEREVARRTDLETRLPPLEAAEAELSERARVMAEARRRLDSMASEVGALRTDVEVRVAGVEERRRFLTDRIAQVDERLNRNHAERVAAEQRRLELDARAEVTDALIAFVADRLISVESVLDVLRDARRRQSEKSRAVSAHLEGLRRRRAASEKELEENRERMQRAEISDAETRLRLETATESLRSELDSEPEAAIAAECPELPDGVSPQARLRELEREVRLMGPINPLALQEFEALQERHQFLEAQLEDIRATRKELSKVIRAVDEEIVNVFASAYADVSQNFSALFDMLFPGGQGGLSLTDSANLLDTGIEIEARPSGKNVRKLSLLSGGERSLVALAYLFAVFRSRPSPFYVMDEVEAALDDVNLHRFLALVAEFRSTAQLLIVSHQKRTMEAADVLYGVTMEPGGSSRVLSEKVAASS
ncbi:MAG: chromosome segregation protein SMC [Acidimicrobiales bacterium]